MLELMEELEYESGLLSVEGDWWLSDEMGTGLSCGVLEVLNVVESVPEEA